MTRAMHAPESAASFATLDLQERAGLVPDQAKRLTQDGYVVLSGLVPPAVIDDARRRVTTNIGLFKNTRPNPSSGHLAGFHRYPALEPLHTLLSNNAFIMDILMKATGGLPIRSIGLSDITVNRSQEWHVDLLRGAYQHHLTPDICWGTRGGGVYKILLYLQAGNSLKTMPGAHLAPVPLDSDRKCGPSNSSQVKSISVGAGDVILMDVRLPHRGSSEEELQSREFLAAPKILISTVLGADRKPLTRAMEIGNFERLLHWDALHRHGPKPQLAANE